MIFKTLLIFLDHLFCVKNMSNQYNFGELSFKDDELDTQAGFSTIDLGGGVQPPVDARNNEKNDDNNNNLNTGSSYTSFGEALSTKTR